MARETVRARDLALFNRHRIARPREVLLRPVFDPVSGARTGEMETVIESEADYRAHALALLHHTDPRAALVESGATPPAYVNDGRWVIDCSCGSGAAADPEMGIAICCECGTVYRPAFPADWKVAEAVLLARPRVSTRNWAVGETVETLRAENTARGIAGAPVAPGP